MTCCVTCCQCQLFQTSNKEELLEQLMECDVVIYDIIQDPQQVDEACWAISALNSELERIDKPKIFILLSTVMTWAKSKPADPVSRSSAAPTSIFCDKSWSLSACVDDERTIRISHSPRRSSDEGSRILATRSI